MCVNITIVDDSQIFNNLLVTILGRDNYNIVPFTDALRFLKVATPEKIDLLILDISLGNGLNGFSVYKQFKNQHDAEVPVIFMSTDKYDSYYQISKALNAVAFLPKDELSALKDLIDSL